MLEHLTRHPCRLCGIAMGIIAAAASADPTHAQCEVVNLVASDAGPNASFGIGVAIDGDTVLVGADLAEVVYAFDRNGGGVENWGETGTLRVTDGSDTDRYGSFVSIEGDIAVVGAYWADLPTQPRAGAAWIFERGPDGQWEHMKKLTAPQPGFLFLYGVVAMDGDTIFVGSPLDEVIGAAIGSVYVYQRHEGGPDNWGLVQRLNASDAQSGDQFGFSVAIDGPIAIVGAIYDDGSVEDKGSAYVFERNDDGIFLEIAKLSASDAAEDDFFGEATSVAGELVVIGAYGNDDAGQRSGSAYVFEREADLWSETAKLVASDAGERDRFGTALAITDDEKILIGATKPGNDEDSGAVYVFRRDAEAAGGWSEFDRLTSPNASGSAFFGCSIATRGDLAVVGAFDDLTAGHDSGSAFIFDLARCLCPADLDASGAVGPADLNAILAAWGACDGCPEDLDGDGLVGFGELREALSNWGPCP